MISCDDCIFDNRRYLRAGDICTCRSRGPIGQSYGLRVIQFTILHPSIYLEISRHPSHPSLTTLISLLWTPEEERSPGIKSKLRGGLYSKVLDEKGNNNEQRVHRTPFIKGNDEQPNANVGSAEHFRPKMVF